MPGYGDQPEHTEAEDEPREKRGRAASLALSPRRGYHMRTASRVRPIRIARKPTVKKLFMLPSCSRGAFAYGS